jgi:hypothetical protein
MQENRAKIDLLTWQEDRLGNGPMRVRFAETLDKNGSPCSFFEYGDKINIKVGIEAELNSKFMLGITIRNGLGQLLLHLNSPDDVDGFISHSNVTVIIASIEKIILNNGDYYISIYLGDRYKLLNDRVGNCLSFSVTNKTLGHIENQGQIIVPVEWEADG